MAAALLLAVALATAPDGPAAALPSPPALPGPAPAVSGADLQPAAPGASYRRHGRLVLSAEAGGGWASDAYLGADLGQSGLLQLAPAARLDVSFTPGLKGAAGAAVHLSRLPAADFGSLGATAGGELRWVGAGVEGALALAGDAASYSAPTPLEGAAGPGVDATLAVLLSPALRLRRGSLSGRLAATGELRRSRTDGPHVDERGLSALAGLGAVVRRWLLLDGQLSGERVASDAPEFAHSAGALSATAVADTFPRGPELTLELSGQGTRFDTGREEWLVRAGVEASQPVGPLELVVSWGGARSEAAGGGSADTVSRRQAWYLGVRGRRQVLSW
ncbi:MAG: hypothetical protein QM767_25625 [Anaeromyxobacter sp.]